MLLQSDESPSITWIALPKLSQAQAVSIIVWT
jgi:hypothetical protein